MIKVVLDTNVIISALLYGGNPSTILESCIYDNKIEAYISPEILAELISKLKFKFGIDDKKISIIKDIIITKFKYVLVKESSKICRDEDDNKILDLAISSKVDFIITGYKGLLTLKSINGIRILNPREFSLEILK
jgi:putative PIN family toxin of toxin-antitoxin system